MILLRILAQRVRSMTSIEIALLPFTLFLGLGWIRAGVEKAIDPSWWTGAALTDWLLVHRATAISIFPFVSEYVFEPFALTIAIVVMAAQLVIGVGILTGRSLRDALHAGLLLNLVFIAMGEVDPSAFYVMMQLSLLTALNLGLIGDDRRPAELRRAVGWGYTVAFAAPQITTLHPAEVIHDPALMISTIGVIAAGLEFLLLFRNGYFDAPPTQPMAVPRVDVRFTDPVGAERSSY